MSQPESKPDVPSVAVPGSTAPAISAGTEEKGLINYELFSKIDLRVATVLEAREHPNANKLLVLKIKVGDVEKQIVAGIKAHYSPESLTGTQIVIVNNLEPAMLRGEESHGMLLAASAGDQVMVLRPDRELPAGARVK